MSLGATVVVTETQVQILAVAQQGPQGPAGTPGSAGGSSAYATTNKDAGTLSPGMASAVHSSGTGVVKASAADNSKNAVGLAVASAAPSAAVSIQTAGLFVLADWTAVTGTATLAARALYFLDVTAGKLTTTPPSTTGHVVQPVGVAVAPDTLDMDIQDAIIL